MLSEGDEENSIYEAFATPFNIIKHAGTKRATSSILKSCHKDTEAGILQARYRPIFDVVRTWEQGIG